jgi:hypothetical protein
VRCRDRGKAPLRCQSQTSADGPGNLLTFDTARLPGGGTPDEGTPVTPATEQTNYGKVRNEPALTWFPFV